MTARRDPVGLVVLAGIGVVAIVVSATTLADLARATGWPEWQSWGLPVCLDAMAGYCVWRYLTAPRKARVRTIAQVVAWLALVGSIAGNATAHLLVAPPTARTLVVLLVAAVPPLAVFGVVELYALDAGPMPARPQRVASAAADKMPEIGLGGTSATGTYNPPETAAPQLHSVPDDASEWDRALAFANTYRQEKGRLPGRRPLMAELNVGPAKGQEYADRLKVEAA